MIAPLVMATMLWAPQAVLLLEPPFDVSVSCSGRVNCDDSGCGVAVLGTPGDGNDAVAATGCPPTGTTFDVPASCSCKVNGDLDATGCPPAGALFSGSDFVDLNCTCCCGGAGGLLEGGVSSI